MRNALVPSLMIAALLAASCGGSDSDGANAEAFNDGTVASGSGEVFLEPTASTGADPFIEATAEVVPEPIFIAQPAVFAESEPVLIGTDPGLYGGTKDNSSCNRDAVIAFLEQTPDKAQAWADAQAIAVDDIRPFIEELTPVVLLSDTRVTNHGFKNGVANPIQSVMQAGTAVLIDTEGVPRVRCACGNPLKKPVPQTTVVYEGEPWAGFDETAVVTVEGGAPADSFELADVETGQLFARVAGSVGDADSTIGTESTPTTTAFFGYLVPGVEVNVSGPASETGGSQYLELPVDEGADGVLLAGPTTVSLSFNTAGGPFSGTYTMDLSGESIRDKTIYTLSAVATLSGTYDNERGDLVGTLSWSSTPSHPSIVLPSDGVFDGAPLPCESGVGVCIFGGSDPNLEMFFTEILLPGVSVFERPG